MIDFVMNHSLYKVIRLSRLEAQVAGEVDKSTQVKVMLGLMLPSPQTACCCMHTFKAGNDLLTSGGSCPSAGPP